MHRFLLLLFYTSMVLTDDTEDLRQFRLKPYKGLVDDDQIDEKREPSTPHITSYKGLIEEKLSGPTTPHISPYTLRPYVGYAHSRATIGLAPDELTTISESMLSKREYKQRQEHKMSDKDYADLKRVLGWRIHKKSDEMQFGQTKRSPTPAPLKQEEADYDFPILEYPEIVVDLPSDSKVAEVFDEEINKRTEENHNLKRPVRNIADISKILPIQVIDCFLDSRIVKRFAPKFEDKDYCDFRSLVTRKIEERIAAFKEKYRENDKKRNAKSGKGLKEKDFDAYKRLLLEELDTKIVALRESVNKAHSL